MKQLHLIFAMVIVLISSTNVIKAQDKANKLKLSGELLTDERFLLATPNDWAWNENRLTLKFDKKFAGKSKFYSEVWLRNLGLPKFASVAGLYNKGIIDPYNLEIREAYVQLYGFLSKNLDMKIGKQRIAWGTADKLNPTDNLNPYDLEDILDFGRHRGSLALNLQYYFNSEFSMQGVYIPLFQPDNLPIGIWADALSPAIELPPEMTLIGITDHVSAPKYNFGKSATAGLKFKGFAAGIDFSLSYVWGRDGLPIDTYNTFTPVDTTGGISINSDLSFYRHHIFGADMATSIGGVGFWAEAAAFLPEHEIVMTTDLTAMFPGTPVPITQDSIVLEKEVYVKFVVGADYIFTNGIYLNFQYLHGFVNERGSGNLNDYFFVQLEKKFFDDKFKIVPIAGGFIISDWSDVGKNYSIIYVPSVSYMATENVDLTLSVAVFDGKGDDIFAKFKGYDMFIFRMKYNF